MCVDMYLVCTIFILMENCAGGVFNVWLQDNTNINQSFTFIKEIMDASTVISVVNLNTSLKDLNSLLSFYLPCEEQKTQNLLNAVCFTEDGVFTWCKVNFRKISICIAKARCSFLLLLKQMWATFNVGLHIQKKILRKLNVWKTNLYVN